ncbi:MAG: hypothetical protein H6Q68_2704 [Firmicutes bacterium]|nr:hypothetical protein [Bacillota bacterium]
MILLRKIGSFIVAEMARQRQLIQKVGYYA